MEPQQKDLVSNRDLAGPNYSEEVIVLNERVKKLKIQVDDFETKLKTMREEYKVPTFSLSKLCVEIKWSIMGGVVAWIGTLIITGFIFSSDPGLKPMIALAVATVGFILWTTLMILAGRLFGWHD